MVGAVGVPLLALVMPPVAAAALLLPVYIVSDMVGLWAYRKEYSARNLAILLPAMIFGVGLGWATARITEEWMVTLLVGLVGLYYCATVGVPEGQRTAEAGGRAAWVFWGTITGFTSFVSHTGGPPYQTYVLPQKLPKMMFAGTSTIVFAVINLVKLAALLGARAVQPLQPRGGGHALPRGGGGRADRLQADRRHSRADLLPPGRGRAVPDFPQAHPSGAVHMKLPFTTYDVFTNRRFGGNPLAIVEEADALSDAADADHRARVQPVRDDLRPDAHGPRQHRERAHLLPHRRDPVCRPSHGGLRHSPGEQKYKPGAPSRPRSAWRKWRASCR